MRYVVVKPENIFIKEDMYKLGGKYKYDMLFFHAYYLFLYQVISHQHYLSRIYGVDFGLASALNSGTNDVEEGDARYMAKELLSDHMSCDLTKVGTYRLY